LSKPLNKPGTDIPTPKGNVIGNLLGIQKLTEAALRDCRVDDHDLCEEMLHKMNSMLARALKNQMKNRMEEDE
jgi:hypothetical protein